MREMKIKMHSKFLAHFPAHAHVGAWLTLLTLLAGACASVPANTTSSATVAAAAPTEAATEASAAAVPTPAVSGEAVVPSTTQQEATAAPSQPAPAANDEAATRLHVPTGFKLNTFVSGLNGPRLMTVGSDGNLYVAERAAGAVIRLPDANGDGVADERQVVAEGLHQP